MRLPWEGILLRNGGFVFQNQKGARKAER